VKFYEVYPDTNFVAAPWKGSVHNRGCAVDLTLVILQTGKQLEMPTPFDDFTEKAAHSYMNLPDQVLKNRQILKDIMTKHGFLIYEAEWWHYDFKDWKSYKLMDISFEELNSN
jgi:D-alanyl-D-alanine dipeptidase